MKWDDKSIFKKDDTESNKIYRRIEDKIDEISQKIKQKQKLKENERFKK